MRDGIDVRVSPTFHPDTVRALPGFNDETEKFLGGVVSAFNDVYVTLAKIHDARELAESNDAWTPENRILIVNKEASKHRERVSKRLDRVHDDIKAAIAHAEGLLAEPLVQQAVLGTLNVEVRTFAKGLDRSERTKLINDALAADDERTLTALLGAQPFLSGLSREEQDHYVHQYHSKKSPHLVARLAAMQNVLDLIYRSGPALHAEFAKAIGASPADINRIEGANERALAALKIEPTA